MTTEQTETSPAQTLAEANAALVSAIVEVGYKAQTRSLNVARVFVEGAGRQQQTTRKFFTQIIDPTLPWNSPERYSAFMNAVVEYSNEALRVSREYIDELNAAATESRETIEGIVRQAQKVGEAQQAMLGEGFTAFRQFATSTMNAATRAAETATA